MPSDQTCDFQMLRYYDPWITRKWLALLLRTRYFNLTIDKNTQRLEEHVVMKKVYSSTDTMFLGHLRNLLENEGISCEILRDHLLGTIGGLPPGECWAELWILEDRQHEIASEIINSALKGNEEEKAGLWRCRSCGEEIEGQFIECWKCGVGKYDSH